ncbi:MAG: hypothetical protein JSV78_05805, partial [Phycisphaerales bacterium]
MRNQFLAWGLLVLMLGVLVGESEAGVPPDAEMAMRSLQSQAPQARFMLTGSRFTRVYGQPLSFGSSAQESAEQFRLDHAAVFEVATDDLQPQPFAEGGALGQPVMYQPERSSYKFTLFRYDQHKDGVPVFRSQLKLLVLNEANFPLVMAASS